MLKKYFFTLCFCFCLGPWAFAQAQLDWDALADVQYAYEYSEAFKTWYSKPEFGESVKQLNEKEVQIKGFILPLDVAGDYFILSAFPYASCFFCGGAGQESVIELRFKKKKPKFNMDDIVTFKGKLLLNDLPLEMSYILEDAEVVKRD